jgi:hypothetical protein
MPQGLSIRDVDPSIQQDMPCGPENFMGHPVGYDVVECVLEPRTDEGGKPS